MTSATRPNPLAFIEAEIDDLKARHLYRPLRVMSAAQGPVTVVDGREVISLSSNDYLGLTHHPRLREAALRAVGEYGVGSGAVRTIAWTMTEHEALETELAAFKCVEAVLTCHSGFTAKSGRPSLTMVSWKCSICSCDWCAASASSCVKNSP